MLADRDDALAGGGEKVEILHFVDDCSRVALSSKVLSVATAAPARYSWARRCTYDLEVPVAWAIARTDRPFTRTALTQYLARSMADTLVVGVPES